VAAGSIAIRNREAIERLAKPIRKATGLPVSFGYLDHGEPLIQDVLKIAAQERAGWLIVLPCLLFAGQYMRTLKRMVDGVRQASHATLLKLGEPFGLDPRMPAVVESLAARLLQEG
jgi:sirohydrochlorin ferrochelatase